MSNVIHIDFLRGRKRKRLTVSHKRSTMKRTAATLERLNELMRRIRESR